MDVAITSYFHNYLSNFNGNIRAHNLFNFSKSSNIYDFDTMVFESELDLETYFDNRQRTIIKQELHTKFKLHEYYNKLDKRFTGGID